MSELETMLLSALSELSTQHELQSEASSRLVRTLSDRLTSSAEQVSSLSAQVRLRSDQVSALSERVVLLSEQVVQFSAPAIPGDELHAKG